MGIGIEWVLQSRWKPVLTESGWKVLYYGVRNPPYQREVGLPVSETFAAWAQDPAQASDVPDASEIETLVSKGVLVKPGRRRTDVTPDTMQTCVRCVNNDYVIPGLEFDDTGVCALCQCYAQAPMQGGRSAFATVSEAKLLKMAEKNTHARFDCMVFYTGGKDSSYLLWLLARRLKLRTMAAFWNMPYCSEAAYANIRRARKRMPEVEFVEWSLPNAMVRKAMKAKWQEHGWPCLCPTAAFPTLYPLAAQLRIPYVFLGIEDVQAAVLDYVVTDPAAPAPSPVSERDYTLSFLTSRTTPRELTSPMIWPDEMRNYHAAVCRALPGLFDNLAQLVETARRDPSIDIPLIGRLSTNEEYGTWDQARRVIEEEMGWQAPAGQHGLLHTSCAIETVKDYLQFQRFKSMRTVFMPQSIIELSAAVFFGLTERDDALRSVQELGYWKPPAMLGTLIKDLDVSHSDMACESTELHYSLGDWKVST